MYIDTVPNRNSKPTILIREGWREGKKTFTKTIANISHWPAPKVNALKALLKGKSLVPAEELFAIEKSTPHGHVEAILRTIKKLKLDTIISSKPCHERDLVLAMIIQRLLYPYSKPATTVAWHSTSLAYELGIEDSDEDDLYKAMDWLIRRQSKIENKLAGQHFHQDCIVMYDISSSYYEGRTCPLIAYGHNRDDKRGKQIIVYGLMTDTQGCPVAVDVYQGNTADPTTVIGQVNKLRERFGLSKVILVGDRGMLTQTNIDTIKTYPNIGWISALKSGAIRKLVEQRNLQLSLFDKQNLAQISSVDYPGERLIACMNPYLAQERNRKRLELLKATENKLEKIAKEVSRKIKRPLSREEIGIKVGKVINQYKVGKHFKIEIRDGFISWERRKEQIELEASLDGIYVIRTSESEERISAQDTVRSYKRLAFVERAFRSLKGIDILIRPIRHRTEDRVRAHIFICMLAYYVKWHMRKALAPLLFDDEEQDSNWENRGPVASAKPSASADKKRRIRKTEDGFPIHSFDTLIAELGTRCRNQCRTKASEDTGSFIQYTKFSPLQTKAFKLLGLFSCSGN